MFCPFSETIMMGRTFLASFGLAQVFYDIVVKFVAVGYYAVVFLVFLRRHYYLFHSRGYAGVNGYVTRTVSHHLHEENAVVRSRRVAYLVDSLHSGVYGRIEAYRIVGAVYVVIYRAWNAHDPGIPVSC